LVNNRLILRAGIASKEQLRFTPAGVAVLSFTVDHNSTQSEAGQPRSVMLSLDCVAIGDNAKSLDHVETGRELEMSGFLSHRSNKSRWIVFHVTEFELK